MEISMDTEEELLRLEKETRKQRLVALLMKLSTIAIFGYVFLPFFYHTVVYKIAPSGETISSTFTWYYGGKT
jgi:hypothetical protein